jgi:hypothetical protein
MLAEHGRAGPWEWAATGRPLAGEAVSGDHWVAVEDRRGTSLFAVIDGLGHGPPAAEAAAVAAAVLRDNASEPLDAMLLLCHQALVATRGAAITVASIGAGGGELRWLGVGNVAGTLVRPSAGRVTVAGSPLLRGGIVGYQLPTLIVPEAITTHLGDLLIMATDGVSPDVAEDVRLALPADQLAAELLQRRGSEADDATILVARHRGTTV